MPGQWHDVPAIVPAPNLWGPEPAPHFGRGVLLVLASAVDTRESGLALFPETVREELHGMRSVVEAFSRGGTLGGRDVADACGVMLSQNAPAASLRVATADGRVTDYRIDRWD
jgi:hypothetical protein